MKILLGSHHFAPSTGGIETVSNLLAHEFVRQGHEVKVVTQTEGNNDYPFSVIRRPGPLELTRELHWADLFFQNNISLRMLWPILLVRRPLFVVHQTWITGPDGEVGWQHSLKHKVLRMARNFSISRAIAEHLGAPSEIIGNPYDENVFRDEGGQRPIDLVCVGRLVSDKGVDVLLEALAVLRDGGLNTRLTIVGDGPERTRLQNLAFKLELQSRVEFVGGKTSHELAAILNGHRILVVPSRLPEPFGIVAVEAIACGCVVIGSAEGGLPEAIGPCGVTFPNGDAGALAVTIQRLLGDPEQQAALRARASEHLAQFSTRRVAGRYLEAMEQAR